MRIFTRLSTGVTAVRYGGITKESVDGSSPPMGSGHLPSNDLKRPCYFSHVQISGSDYNLVDIDDSNVQTFGDASTSCYDVTYFGNYWEDFRLWGTWWKFMWGIENLLLYSSSNGDYIIECGLVFYQ